jgi:hypothetical protein
MIEKIPTIVRKNPTVNIVAYIALISAQPEYALPIISFALSK